jgi:hypothetical protein
MHLTAASVLRLPRGSRLAAPVHGGLVGGLASGVEIERWGAIIYTFRRGKILRVDAALFSDRETVSELVRSIAENEPAGEVATARR